MKNFKVSPTMDVEAFLSKGETVMSRFPFGYNDKFEVSFTPIRAGIWNIFLFGEIEDASQFTDAIQVLQMAGENDMVIIHLSTNGGSLDATDTFLTAMKECDARILVKATGGVHSAGSVILLNADEFSLSENFNCLVHNGYVGPGGKYSDWKVQAKHTEAYMERVMNNTYAGFLSPQEITDLINGKDFMLDADQFVQRWEARQEYLRAQLEGSQNDVLSMLSALTGEKPAKKPRKPRKKKEAEEAVTE